MGKFIIEESEKKRILSLYKNFINEDLNNDKEDIVLTYTSIKRKGNTNEVYFNNIKLNYNGTLYVKYLDISNIINELYSSDRLGDIILKIPAGWAEKPNGFLGYSGEISDYITNYNDITLISGEQDSTSVLVEIDDRIKRLRPYTKMIEIEKSKGVDLNDRITEWNIDEYFKKHTRKLLKIIYGNTENWVERSYGNSNKKRFGIINIKTLDSITPQDVKDKSTSQGDDWSIINYFDTNPKVREKIIKKFENEEKLSIKGSKKNLNKFGEWMTANKEILFKEGPFFESLVNSNSESYLTGVKNEGKAFKYVEDRLPPDFIMGGINLPGSPEDMRGIDFSTINKQSNKEFYFQAKPLSGVVNNNGQYIIYSYKIRYLKTAPVDYFIFTSHTSPGIICFKKIDGQFEIPEDNNKKIIFNYPPVFWDPNY